MKPPETIVVSKDEWESMMANRIAGKSFKVISAIVIPLIAFLAYFGFNIVHDAKTNIQQSKEDLKTLQERYARVNDSLANLFNSQLTANEILQKGNSMYGETYQRYIENLFSSYVSNSQQMMKEMADVKMLEQEYAIKKAEFDEKIQALALLKTENYQFREQLSRNFDSIQNNVLKSNLKVSSQIKDLSNSEVLVLTENTPNQYSKVSNTKITFKDIDKRDSIKLKINDFNTGREIIPLSFFKKWNTTYFYNNDSTNKYSLEVKEIVSQNFWKRDYSIILIVKLK